MHYHTTSSIRQQKTCHFQKATGPILGSKNLGPTRQKLSTFSESYWETATINLKGPRVTGLCGTLKILSRIIVWTSSVFLSFTKYLPLGSEKSPFLGVHHFLVLMAFPKTKQLRNNPKLHHFQGVMHQMFFCFPDWIAIRHQQFGNFIFYNIFRTVAKHVAVGGQVNKFRDATKSWEHSLFIVPPMDFYVHPQ